MRAAISSFCDYVTEWLRVVKQPYEQSVRAAFLSSQPVQPKDVIPIIGHLAVSACRWVACVT